MRCLVFAPLAGLLAMSPAKALAQTACAYSKTHPAVGAWAEYRPTKPGAAEGRFRFSVIGTETRHGVSMIWIEFKGTVSFPNQPDTFVISQSLVPDFPVSGGAIEEMVIKHSQLPAFRLTGSSLRSIVEKNSTAGDPLSILAKACGTLIFVGEESVTVPAGTFRSKHYRDPSKDINVWLSHEMPFAAIKFISASEKQTIELMSSGKGARSSITETPVVAPGH